MSPSEGGGMEIIMLQLNPLSWTKYVRSNPKRVLILISTVMSGVFLLVISKMIVFSMENNIYRCWVNPMKEMSVCVPLTENKLKTNSDAPKYKVFLDEIYLKGALGKVSTYVYFTEDEGMDYIVKNLKIKLIEGSYPEQGTNEIVIHWDLAKNKDLGVGDYIGKEVDAKESINGKYKISGIIESDAVISIGSLEYYQSSNHMNNSGYIFSAKEKGLFEGKEGNDYEEYNYEEEISDYENSVEVVKLCLYLIIGFIYIIVGFTILFMTYIFYSQRKKEICILIALGRTKKMLLLRSFKEVFFINCMGCVKGSLLAMLIGQILNLALFNDLGQPLVICKTEYYIVPTLLVCLLTILIMLMIWNMVRKTDYVSVIEGDI